MSQNKSNNSILKYSNPFIYYSNPFVDLFELPLFVLLFITVFLLLNSCNHNKDVQPPCVNCPVDFRVTDFEPAWSPDGKYIAYVHGDTAPGKSGIYIITPEGKENTLFHLGTGASEPTWSPDGQWIAFSDGGQIWKKKLNGDSLIQLTTYGKNFFPSWSPDGNLIAYHRSYAWPEDISVQGIWLLRIKGDSIKQIFSGNSGYPFWLSSSKLSFIRGVSTEGRRSDSLWLYKINEDEFSKLISLDGVHDYPSYSPVSNMLVVTTTLLNSKPQIFIMDLNGLDVIQLTQTQAYSCDWSPDGKQIIYTDSRAISGRLWLMNADGSAKKPITF